MKSSYSLWVEGYAATGEHGTARFLGSWQGETFDNAVKAWNESENPGGKKWGVLKYNEEYDRWSVWGCRIYDNEADARKAFG